MTVAIALAIAMVGVAAMLAHQSIPLLTHEYADVDGVKLQREHLAHP